MPSVPDLSGRFVGEYEIRALLGVGGMGAVYEGRHPVIGKRVAVKVLLPALSEARPLVERFIDEARAVNEIGHRGIVDIFAFGKLPEGSVYFVMEYLDGQPLDRLVKAKGPLPLADALAYTEEICDALAAAHQAGIIHRDIKPSNIFLVSNQRGQSYLKLLDFGIAKLGANSDEASPQTMEGLALGTPDYMSPEQARGMPISPAADLYSVGCVLFELLTGRRVFKGPNPQRTMFMHAEDPPPVPSSLRPEVPEALDNLVLWMLEKYPDARPKSATEVKAHCAALRQQLPGSVSTGAVALPVTPIPPRRPSSPTPLPSSATPGVKSPTQSIRPPRPPADAMPAEVPGPAIPPEVPGVALPPALGTSQSRSQLDPVMRAARAEADLAELDAGKVVIIARPPDAEIQDAPTKVVPVLEPVLVALRANAPEPAPWIGTDKHEQGANAGPAPQPSAPDLGTGSFFQGDPAAPSAPRPSSPRTPNVVVAKTPAPTARPSTPPPPARSGTQPPVARPSTPPPPARSGTQPPVARPSTPPPQAPIASPAPVADGTTDWGKEIPTNIDRGSPLALRARKRRLAAVGIAGGLALSALILWLGLRSPTPEPPPLPIQHPVLHDDGSPPEPGRAGTAEKLPDKAAPPEESAEKPLDKTLDKTPDKTPDKTVRPDLRKPHRPRVEAKADDPKPDKPGVSAQQLIDRIARCESLLAKREAAKGADPVLRGFVAQVRAEAAHADTEAQRREVLGHVNDLLQQLSE